MLLELQLQGRRLRLVRGGLRDRQGRSLVIAQRDRGRALHLDDFLDAAGELPAPAATDLVAMEEAALAERDGCTIRRPLQERTRRQDPRVLGRVAADIGLRLQVVVGEHVLRVSE